MSRDPRSPIICRSSATTMVDSLSAAGRSASGRSVRAAADGESGTW